MIIEKDQKKNDVAKSYDIDSIYLLRQNLNVF